jgi:YbbR domain-containing protein
VPARLELAGQVPADVYVRVRGHSAVLRRMTVRDLAIVIDLAGSAPGEALIRLAPEAVDAPAGVEVVRIAPAQIRLQLTERLSP